jgi:hypothetical protein
VRLRASKGFAHQWPACKLARLCRLEAVVLKYKQSFVLSNNSQTKTTAKDNENHFLINSNQHRPGKPYQAREIGVTYEDFS